MSGPVVVVGDGELTTHVAGWAAGLARRTGRDLRLVVVLSLEPPAGEPERVASVARVLVRSDLDHIADDVASRSGAVDVEAEVRVGCWADVVADEERTASVVVVPHDARSVGPAHVVAADPEPGPRGSVWHRVRRLTTADAGPGVLRTR